MVSTINKKSSAKEIGTLPLAYKLELHRLTELNAYLIAEADGFRKSPLEYWLAAERDLGSVIEEDKI